MLTRELAAVDVWFLIIACQLSHTHMIEHLDSFYDADTRKMDE